MLPAVAARPLGSPVLPEVNLIVVTSPGRMATRGSGLGRAAAEPVDVADGRIAERPDGRVLRLRGRSVNSTASG